MDKAQQVKSDTSKLITPLTNLILKAYNCSNYIRLFDADFPRQITEHNTKNIRGGYGFGV
jgi:hypothetical protein